MDFVEKWGANVDEAVGLALQEMKLSKEDVEVTVLEEPSRGFFGILANKHFKLIDDSLGPIPWVLFELVELFQWIFMLNLGIGLFNLLPIKPLDGGYMLEILLSYKMSEKYYKPIITSLSVVLALIIVFSIVAGFL